MTLIDFYPDAGSFTPGRPVRFVLELEADQPASLTLRLRLTHLATTVEMPTFPLEVSTGRQEISIAWTPPLDAPRGYGAQAELFDPQGNRLGAAATAFDVLPHWTAFPRYGFLTDFSPERSDIAETVKALVRYHLNGLQFYDWQYRHDCLVPPSIEYVDPLGRRLSLRTVQRFIAAAHAHGMAAMPYLAVYAASAEYWRAHPEAALYDAHGSPIPFGDNFLGLMNPAPQSEWALHLQTECGRVLTALPFDGLHVDQYGEPKIAYDAVGQPVDLPAAFAGFISSLKEAHPHLAVVFNAVGNWPIESLAASPQDFVYIEIWPPDTSYRDLARIVTQARALSGGKPVVIALYLPASRPANNRLADAVIASGGGTRIELGENARLLADPYFPKHQALTPELAALLRRYADFVVRYEDLIGPAAHWATECEVSTSSEIWSSARLSPGWLTICLVNLNGLQGAGWDTEHARPICQVDIPVSAMCSAAVGEAWWASPDGDSLDLQPLAVHGDGSVVSVTLPRLDYWALIAFKLKP